MDIYTNILDKYNLNAYDILGIDSLSDMETIKKAYKKKAIIIHPDKTNGKTEADFKLLVIAYRYAKENCMFSEVSCQNELRSKHRDEIIGEDRHDKNIYNTNFQDDKERQVLFADDQINFEDFEEKMKRIQNLPTSYTAETFYKKDILDKMKTNGKFNSDKFNAFFLKLKKEGKTSTDLTIVEKVKAINEDDLYMRVNIHDGMVINTFDTKDTSNYKENYIVSQEDVDNLLQTDINTIENLIKEHKKDTDKISKKKIKEMVMKKSQPIAVDRSKSFSQLESDLNIMNIIKIQQDKKKQKETVDMYKNIYIKTLPEFIG